MTAFVIGEVREELLQGITSGGSFSFPGGCAIDDIQVVNNTANAITGGLKFGTTAGGVDIVAALAVGANGITSASLSAGLLKKLFSKTNAQTIHYDAVTAWNSANVDIVITYRRVFP